MWLRKLFVIVVMLGLLGLFGTYFWNLLPGEARDMLLQGTIAGLPDVDENVSSSFVQFEPNMRFNHNDLTYSFVSECSQDKIHKMNQAFDIIHSETGLITFEEISGFGADILVSCSRERVVEEGNVFITGEGGPSKFLNLSLYPLIVQGEILLYEDLYKEHRSRCDEPVVEIHELLHVFGYDHIDNKSSVLYPYFACNQVLDKELVNDLVNLYSVEPRAEIYYGNVSAVKGGAYLDFNISVVNQGLLDAEGVVLVVYGDGRKQKEFNLNDIGVGTITTFSIENLRLSSRGVSEIEFKIISSTEEYDLGNNVVKLSVVDQ
jgi:hypothetical protein